MTTVIALAAGAASGTILWRVMRPTLAQPLFERENYRGHHLPVAAGLVVVLATLVVAATWLLVLAGSANDAVGPVLAASAASAAGFGLLGLLDDLAGTGASRGFTGHLRSLADGRVTTGILKLVGGGVVAVVIVAPTTGDGPGGVLARAAVVALAANLGNLFDRAPGRAIKVALLAFALVAVVQRDDDTLAGPAITIGAALALLVPDLRERCMLGDTGANVLGAAVGLALAVSVTTTSAIAAAAVLAALNLVSERISFSRVIDRVAPLRWADRLGAPYRPR
jgi:UDP-GlcNAc:undecaprenyl-phosphate/decaprenyl-phosphate GlcNAc-1-phosphate transferase